MTSLIGEFEATVDAKGRVLFPSALKRQLPAGESDKYVLNRGFEKQINLYPDNVWKEVSAKLSELNLFETDARTFYRRFHSGATPVILDGQGRLLLPQRLMVHAGIKKEIVFYAFGDRIEIWSLTEFNKMISDKSVDMASLAEKVMGNREKKQ